jgi:ferredoxin
MTMSGQTFRIAIGNTGATIDCGAEQTILRAAVTAGIDYPYGCATGNCGACISQLDAGDVSLLPRSDASLSPAQAAAGQTLACRARPRSDVTITWLGRGRR